MFILRGNRFRGLAGNLGVVTTVHCQFDRRRLRSQLSMSLKPPEHGAKFHRSGPVVPKSLSRSQTARRRSSRIALNAPIRLSGDDREKRPFSSLPAKATNLNKHGAAIQLHRDLLVGSKVVVRNQRGGEASARVVAQLAALHGVPTYAIEFVEQDEKATTFWGIAFPSSS